MWIKILDLVKRFVNLKGLLLFAIILVYMHFNCLIYPNKLNVHVSFSVFICHS